MCALSHSLRWRVQLSAKYFTSRISKATGEVHQCWYDEIAAQGAFFVNPELQLLLLDSGR
jgi:hypothetical protein